MAKGIVKELYTPIRDNVCTYSSTVYWSYTCQSEKMIGWRLSHQFFVALFMIGCIGIVVDASRVILTDNGYNNLVVAISYETPITQSETIINNLQVCVIK